MRADRLISILMLLQTYGRMTARQLAEEMEVSERTIYRDIDALCASGVPIFTECGPGGGYELLESYRTELIGLNEQEKRALLMLSIPQPLKELGVGQYLKGALLKLSAAMEDSNSEMRLRNKQLVYLDSTPWSRSYENVPYLSLIHQALIQENLVRIKYQGVFDTAIHVTAAPYGIVAKTSTWYLVFECDMRLRVIRIANILEAIVIEEKFDYPNDFSLSSFWEDWCNKTEASRPSFPVTLSVSPELYKFIRHLHNDISTKVISSDRDGWIRINLSFESFEDARRNILAYGRAAEVVEPISLRMSVIDFACQIKDLYNV